MRKHNLKLHRETVKILTGPALEQVIGGSLLTTIIIGDTGPTCNPPPPPHTNSIAPCCASIHKACPAE